MALHKSLLIGDIHSIVAFTYANETLRLAATGFVASDLYKIARQLDNGFMYLLVSVSPVVWVDVGNASVEQLNKVEIKIFKASSGTLAVGQAVYAASWDVATDHALCELAKANSASTMPVCGIVSQQATDSVEGKVLLLGILHDLDTSSLVAPDPTYLSAATAGLVTTTAPSGPYVVQALGVCLRSHATTGHLGVNILSYRAIQYTTPPASLGTAACGTSNQMSASDHVHAHGNQNGGTLHAAASAEAGFMSAADKTKLNGLGNFGRDYQSAASDGRSTTTSDVFQDKTTLTTPALTGTYRIGWTAVVDHSISSSSDEERLYNETDAAVVGATINWRPSISSEVRHVSGFAEIVFTGAAKTFKIQYRSVNGAATAAIQAAKIEFWRVS